jgi:hypothetical protein
MYLYTHTHTAGDLAGLGSSDTNSEILSPAATLTATSPLLLLLIALLATLMARRA